MSHNMKAHAWESQHRLKFNEAAGPRTLFTALPQGQCMPSRCNACARLVRPRVHKVRTAFGASRQADLSSLSRSGQPNRHRHTLVPASVCQSAAKVQTSQVGAFGSVSRFHGSHAGVTSISVAVRPSINLTASSKLEAIVQYPHLGMSSTTDSCLETELADSTLNRAKAVALRC